MNPLVRNVIIGIATVSITAALVFGIYFGTKDSNPYNPENSEPKAQNEVHETIGNNQDENGTGVNNLQNDESNNNLGLSERQRIINEVNANLDSVQKQLDESRAKMIEENEKFRTESLASIEKRKEEFKKETDTIKSKEEGSVFI